ncbi:UDP-galactose 4-epimerase [Syncephalis fuscata]|nr:UDP-galactose 4-epimerase [Syncephalis fuscata]
MASKTVLVTGGAGYIGSHTCLELLMAGHKVIVIDNLSNSTSESLRRIKQYTGCPITFYKIDILDRLAMNNVFAQHPDIYAVLHFAGLKSVSESMHNPLQYYEVNIMGTLILLQCMDAANIKRIIFSSTATVYGPASKSIVAETDAVAPISPYGNSKLSSEHLIQELCRSDSAWQAILLRYFNPIGKLDKLKIFGGDYDTDDGTGVRDFVHVVDVAKGHMAALNNLLIKLDALFITWEQVEDTRYWICGLKIPYEIVDRRLGDIGKLTANSAKAALELGWQAQLDIDDICRDLWNWSNKND